MGNLDTSIFDLNKAYTQKDLVLVLGAGVSMDCNLPNWNTMMHSLQLSILEDKFNSFDITINPIDINRIFTDIIRIFNQLINPSPLIAARYVQNILKQDAKDANAYENRVHKALYPTGSLIFGPQIHEAIFQLLIDGRNESGINSIITYNFDDFLDMFLEEKGILCKSIYSLGMKASFNEIPIYHVHGFLPLNIKSDIKNRIILSGKEYHKQYMDMYSWNNLVQIDKFCNNTCLFIGISLADPNLRRLLDIALEQNPNKQHYAIVKRYNEKEMGEKVWDFYSTGDKKRITDVTIVHNFDEIVSKLIGYYEDFLNRDALELGIKTIWVNDYNEIPGKLNRIRKGPLV